MRRTSAHEDRAHAPLPPSAAERWIACPPSMGYARWLRNKGRIAPSIPGPAALFGTKCHELSEPFARKLAKGEEVSGLEVAKLEPDVFAVVKCYVDELRLLVAEHDAVGDWRAGVEDTVALRGFETIVWGSADFWIASDDLLDVVDLKAGVSPVNAHENWQTLIYAMGVADQIGYDGRVRVTIVQPRALEGERVKRFEVPSLAPFRTRLAPAIRAASSWISPKGLASDFSSAPFAAGDHCNWCPAIAVCFEARKRAHMVAGDEFAAHAITIPTKGKEEKPIELPKHDLMTPDQIGLLLERISMFETWVKGLRDHAQKLALTGVQIPNHKLVRKRTDRMWKAHVTSGLLTKELGLQDVTRVELKSPSMIEKELQGDAERIAMLQRLVEKPVGDATLVHESDRRPAIEDPKIAFQRVPKEETQSYEDQAAVQRRPRRKEAKGRNVRRHS